MDKETSGAYVLEVAADGRVVVRDLTADDTERYQAIVNIIVGKDGKA